MTLIWGKEPEKREIDRNIDGEKERENKRGVG
jgi:hypothetical protein